MRGFIQVYATFITSSIVIIGKNNNAIDVRYYAHRISIDLFRVTKYSLIPAFRASNPLVNSLGLDQSMKKV